ncbi:MAG: EAL domain-containing protein, partial [Lachnospiraceae bacterium]|nr:EAL domain-containing protein [Lachnospiraceae bacterium]
EEDKENSVRNVMFKNVVTLARQLGLECIAEGVETEFQMNVLRENHCNLAQGYFYDRPLPVTEFEKRLDKGIYE